LRDLASLLPELRRTPTFAALRAVPWQVFVAVALYLRGNAEAWPSQETLGRFCGYAARTVRSGIGELERLALVRVDRDRDRNGLERLRYAPGPTTLRELAGIADRGSAPPDRGSSPPDPGSGDLSRREEEVLLLDRETDGGDAGVARLALAEHFARRYPGRRAPRDFDGADVARVARCAAAIDGDEGTKLRALRDAIDGAFEASHQAPTVRFIWERLEHFFAHVERGERARERTAPASVTTPWASTDVVVPAPAAAEEGPSPAQMQADLDKLFGPGWRTRR
jgi:hypothetical protein